MPQFAQARRARGVPCECLGSVAVSFLKNKNDVQQRMLCVVGVASRCVSGSVAMSFLMNEDDVGQLVLVCRRKFKELSRRLSDCRRLRKTTGLRRPSLLKLGVLAVCHASV